MPRTVQAEVERDRAEDEHSAASSTDAYEAARRRSLQPLSTYYKKGPTR